MITLWILALRCLNLARLEKQNNQNKIVGRAERIERHRPIFFPGDPWKGLEATKPWKPWKLETKNGEKSWKLENCQKLDVGRGFCDFSPKCPKCGNQWISVRESGSGPAYDFVLLVQSAYIEHCWYTSDNSKWVINWILPPATSSASSSKLSAASTRWRHCT